MRKRAATLGAGLALAASITVPVDAVIIYSDDFESYLNTAQMNAPAAWGAVSGVNNGAANTGTLATAGSNEYMSHPGGQQGIHLLGGSFTPASNNPIILEFDLIDTAATNKRLAVTLAQGSTRWIEVGRWNSAGNPEGSSVVDGYAVRTVSLGTTNTGGNSGWFVFTGDPAFVAGTHRMRAVINPTTIEFTLDLGNNGTVDSSRVLNTATGNLALYDQLRIGGPSNVTSGGGSSGFDNVKLFTLGAAELGAFNTGVDASGNVLPANSIDPHFRVTQVASAGAPATTSLFGQPAYVVPSDGFPIPPWLANDADSAWISSSAGPDASDDAGFYDYTMGFNVTNPSTFLINGLWGSDNAGLGIYLNGVLTSGNTQNSFAALSPFSIASGFVAGQNVLTFRVENAPGAANNPTGLHVDFGFFGNVVVPEPATLALGAVSAFALLGVRRRRDA